jgi:copper homeostasis protein
VASGTCLEVSVDSVAGLEAAISGGADRIELCSALSLEGLTPSAGLMAAASACRTPCFVLIRPREGDFCYDSNEIDVMCRDIETVRSMNLAGVVIGASVPDGSLDVRTLARLLECSAGVPAALHRAFDLVPDFHAALETAIELGFKRVLTSGGAAGAPAGCEQIQKLVQQAGTRIEVMAGAGLVAGNVAEFVRFTGVKAVHGSCSSAIGAGGDPGSRAVALGFVRQDQRQTDRQNVTAMVAALKGLTRP